MCDDQEKGELSIKPSKSKRAIFTNIFCPICESGEDIDKIPNVRIPFSDYTSKDCTRFTNYVIECDNASHKNASHHYPEAFICGDLYVDCWQCHKNETRNCEHDFCVCNCVYNTLTINHNYCNIICNDCYKKLNHHTNKSEFIFHGDFDGDEKDTIFTNRNNLQIPLNFEKLHSKINKNRSTYFKTTNNLKK